MKTHRSFPKRAALDVLRVLVLAALAFVMVGCGAGDGSPGPMDGGPPDAAPGACKPGELALDGGGCQPAGLPPDMPCPPGQAQVDGGSCQDAGVPPEACGQGFEPDGNGGCNAILPVKPCPKGQMAVPGDTQCHEVADCGTGDYGNIPGQTDPTTQFVKGDYPGNDSDGTQAKPWKHIQDGIDHAKPGAIVAVAAWSYDEDVLIQVSSVKVWGRCPAMVDVVGTGAKIATLRIFYGNKNPPEVHTLGITGPGNGISTSGAVGVVVDRVWIHDTMNKGLDVEGAFGKTSVTVSASLIEASNEVGVLISNSQAMIEATTVRGTQPIGNGTLGYGISIQDGDHKNERAEVTLQSSLVEQNYQDGVLVIGSDATIEATVVRATHGRGIEVDLDDDTSERSKLTLRASIVEQNVDVGVNVAGSDATIEATTVRDTQPYKDGGSGVGIGAEADLKALEHATLTLRSSLLEHNHETGVFVYGSDATIEATIVRDTQPHSDGVGGDGIDIVGAKDDPKRSTLTLRASILEKNHQIGMLVQSSDATVEATVVRDTQPRSDGTAGLGVLAQDHGETLLSEPTANDRATLTLRTSLLEQNHDIGVLVYGSDATIEATVVRATQRTNAGTHGRGIEVDGGTDMQERSKLTLRATLVEQNHDIGVFVENSDATIESTLVRDTQPQSDGMFGDGIVVESHGGIPTSATIACARAETSARAGIFFHDGTGALTDVVSTNNQYGLVLQGEKSPDYKSSDNQFSSNTKQDVYLNGDLAVPDTASPVPQSP
jgi:Right handed beta helix region